MEAYLKLNLGDTLNSEELSQLTELATREGKTLERVLYEAAKELLKKAAGMKSSKRLQAAG